MSEGNEINREKCHTSTANLQVQVHFLTTSVPSSHVCFGLCTQGSHCRGPDREPGYDRVIALARHLVSFRRQDVLSDLQIAETTRLFHNLPDMDKARVKFPPRHKNQLSSGRFARKKGNVVSGTEIVKR